MFNLPVLWLFRLRAFCLLSLFTAPRPKLTKTNKIGGRHAMRFPPPPPTPSSLQAFFIRSIISWICLLKFCKVDRYRRPARPTWYPFTCHEPSSHQSSHDTLPACLLACVFFLHHPSTMIESHIYSSGEGPCDLRVEGAGLIEADGQYFKAGHANAVPCYTQRRGIGENCYAVVRG